MTRGTHFAIKPWGARGDEGPTCSRHRNDLSSHEFEASHNGDEAEDQNDPVENSQSSEGPFRSRLLGYEEPHEALFGSKKKNRKNQPHKEFVAKENGTASSAVRKEKAPLCQNMRIPLPPAMITQIFARDWNLRSNPIKKLTLAIESSMPPKVGKTIAVTKTTPPIQMTIERT